MIMKALITGVNSYVNKTLLRELVDMGYEVTAHYHTDNDLAKEVRAGFTGVTFLQADFADQDGLEGFLRQAQQTGPFDVVVNAAVWYAEAADPDARFDWNAWQKTFAINTIAAARIMAEAEKLMTAKGVIVNISSYAGQTQFAEVPFTMYSASKAALDSVTVSFAKRLSPDIRVVGIAPGWVRSAWNINMPDAVKQQKIRPQLTHEWIEPSDIAALMKTVITNPGINATTIAIDGGLSAPII
jgi:NAD(P)-dependent dehydrogenase (short-subunit alcohol dehydrogenase family)